MELTEDKNKERKANVKLLPINLYNAIDELKVLGLTDADKLQKYLPMEEYSFDEKYCHQIAEIIKGIKKMKFKNIFFNENMIALHPDIYEIFIQFPYEKFYAEIIYDENVIEFLEKSKNKIGECLKEEVRKINELKKIINLDTPIPVKLNDLPKVIKIAANENYSLSLTENREVWIWGCGNLVNIDKSNFIPKKIENLSDIIDIYAGENFGLAIKNDGKIFLIPVKEIIKFPIQILGIKDFKSIVAGYDEILILNNDLTVSKVNLNTEINFKKPLIDVGNKIEEIKDLKEIIQIAMGRNHVLCLSKDGAIYSWGDNYFGQLGNGNYKDASKPQKIYIKEKVTKVMAAENCSFALTQKGNVYSWGWNEAGQLCTGDYKNRNKPTLIKKMKEIKDIFKSLGTFYALTKDGYLFAWGYGLSGQLGNGKWQNSNIPVRVKLEGDILFIEGGLLHTLSLMKNGDVYAWGYNTCGQIAR